MKKWFIIGVMIAAMAMMVMPGSAYFQVWYADNPADTQIDGLSDVRWINPLSNPDYQYWLDRYNVNTGNFQATWWYWGEVPSTLPNGARHNVEGYPNQEYMFGFNDRTGPDYNAGYYGIGSGYQDNTEMFQNYEGMTTYIQWIPFFDPYAYGEYYGWDPEALTWDPGNSVVI